jgi:hypothetical protein
MTGANFSNWYNQSEGTLFAESSTYTTVAGDRRILSITDGTTNNQAGLHYGTAGSVFISIVQSGGAFQYGPTEGVYGTTLDKRALALLAGGMRAATNGVLAIPSLSSVVMPIGVNSMWIGNRNGTQFLAGHIRRIAYWPRRLSNAELQGVTS